MSDKDTTDNVASAAAILAANLKKEAEAENTPDNMYQHYASSRKSIQMTTPEGFAIRFSNNVFMTKNPAIVAYLDDEIEKGLTFITKGEMLSEADSNPMERLRRKHIQDYLAEQQEKQAALMRGELPDMGVTYSKAGGGLNVATTKDLAAVSKG